MTILSGNGFDNISPTAFLTAYARQFTGIPYTKKISELTNAAAKAKQLTEHEPMSPFMVGLAVLVEGRYKMIEQVRSQFHTTQILELASGLLPRGMILSQHPEITFIESDLANMIQQKQSLTQQLVGERPNLHFLEIDATNNLTAARLKNYFQPDRPVTVLCEGLLVYLTLAEKQQVFANVREILQTFGGVWITPDLPTKSGVEQLVPDAAAQQFDQKFARLGGRGWSMADNMFTDLDNARQFVQEQGFQMTEFSALAVLDQLACLSTLKIERNIVKKLLATIPVFALSLA